MANTLVKGTVEHRSHTFLVMRRVFCYTILILSCVLALFPFITLLVNASRSHAEIQRGFTIIPSTSMWANLKRVLSDGNIPMVSSIINSFIIAASSCLLSVYFSALTAYGLFAYNFRLKNFAFGFIMLIMMVPTQVSTLGFVDMMTDWRLDNTFFPLIVPAIAAPACFFFIKQYMEGALPIEIVEAGRIDGGHEFYIFNALVLPIIKPAMAVQVIFTFVFSWNNYFLPAMLLDSKELRTLPIVIAGLRSASFDNFDMGKVYIMLAIAIIPLIIVYLCLSKFIIRGIALGSVKG